MSPHTAPTRSLREHADLNQLRRQAKELLTAFRAGGADAVAEVTLHYRDADAGTFALHDAQLVLSRAYGFDSWPKLKAFVDGATVSRLSDAVRAGDTGRVTTLLEARPEIINIEGPGGDEHRPLHYAVLARDAGMVRLLMAHGADAQIGIYPHRVPTTAMAVRRSAATRRSSRSSERRKRADPAFEAQSTLARVRCPRNSSTPSVVATTAGLSRYSHRTRCSAPSPGCSRRQTPGATPCCTRPRRY